MRAIPLGALLLYAVAAASPAGHAEAPAASHLVEKGRHLYLLNCARCHAEDATGDEGPDLHDVRRSDARIASLILNGIKGEMPRFNQKLTEADVKALNAFLRQLGGTASR